MRRFIAYVLASLTIFLGIGVSFKPVATRINADLSYRNGNTIYFRLEESKEDSHATFLEYDGKAGQYYADIMASRLDAYGVADYKINVTGDRDISVTLTSDNATECSNIGKLLATNPVIELANLPGKSSNDEEKADQIRVRDDEEKKAYWHSEKAYITYDGSTPIVVMPIPDKLKSQVKDMIAQAKIYENKKSSSNDEPKTTPNSIKLWMNRLSDGSEEYSESDPIIKNKIVYSNLNSENFYYGTDESAFQLKFTPSSSKISDISASYKEALYMMNLLNSSIADFDCIVTYTAPTAATVENLLIYGDHIHIAMSSTFISLMIAFILICLLLALFYRLGAVAIVSAASLNTFLSFALFVFFKPLFNVAALVGVISVFAISIFIGILYNHYLHEEVYKGRSLKKANFEASKKTTLITIDLSAISLILGITMYFIGGKAVASLGVLLTTAALFNLFIDTFVLKGLMWLITNNTNTQKQYKLLGIDESKVPDLMKEEKPSYIGPYENKNFTKKKKLSGIIFGSLTAVSSIGMIIFASVKGDVFNSNQFYEEKTTLHLVFETSEGGTQPTSTEELKNILITNVKHNNNELKIDSDINNYSYSYYKKDGTSTITYNHFVYDVTINESNVNSNEFSYCKKDGSEWESGQPLNQCIIGGVTSRIPGSLFIDEENEQLIKTSKIQNLPSNIGLIYGATSVAIVAVGLYFWVRRYRLSRVIPTVSIGLVSNVISLGLITLTRIPATPVMAVGIGLTTLYTLLASQYIMHKEKDVLRDSRERSIAIRKDALDKALHVSALPLINFTIVVMFISLSFLAISNKTFSSVFFSTTLSIGLSTIMLLTLFTPIADALDSKLSTISIPEIKLKKKKKIITKSNEPEEAIFIGIND